MIRIEIGAMPPLLRSIVSSALETNEDLVVMAPPAREAGGDIAGEEADVLLVCSDRAPQDCIPVRRLAGAEPSAIVAIDSAGASATIVWVAAESTPIAAAADLRAAVRRAAQQRATR